jgi:TRAP-type mannitol/chloroaromatic compound transport system permease small subunit
MVQNDKHPKCAAFILYSLSVIFLGWSRPSRTMWSPEIGRILSVQFWGDIMSPNAGGLLFYGATHLITIGFNIKIVNGFG